MFERKTPVATRVCVELEVIGYVWKGIYLGISFTVISRSVGSLVDLNQFWQSLLASMRRIVAERIWLFNHFWMSNTDTHRLFTIVHNIPSSVDSMILVQRVWKKLEPVHMGRISERMSKHSISNDVWGESLKGCWHLKQNRFSKKPNSLVRKTRWWTASRKPWRRISVETLCMASWISLASCASDDTWFRLWLNDGIWSLKIDLQELCISSARCGWPNLYQCNRR